MALNTVSKAGYCIFVDTLFEGPRPVELDATSNPYVYPTLQEAQRVIAEDTVERIRQFTIGEREFDDAMTVEEYILKVEVQPDGSVCDETGRCFSGDK